MFFFEIVLFGVRQCIRCSIDCLFVVVRGFLLGWMLVVSMWMVLDLMLRIFRCMGRDYLCLDMMYFVIIVDFMLLLLLYCEIGWLEWVRFVVGFDQLLIEIEVVELCGIGDCFDLIEVCEVYFLFSCLFSFYVIVIKCFGVVILVFLQEDDIIMLFVVGVVGFVVVGKLIIVCLLCEFMSCWLGIFWVEFVIIDGFFYFNVEFECCGIMDCKGFFELYDWCVLIEFFIEVKSGVIEVCVLFYFYMCYDIVFDVNVVVCCFDVVIVEGLNVLQLLFVLNDVVVSDLFDFLIFVDVEIVYIEKWYVD